MSRSVFSPEFKYAEARNPYWSKIKKAPPELACLVLTDHDTEAHQGSWRAQFPAGQPTSMLHVEIGCNAGHVSLEWAKKNPNELFIGIDWKFKQAYRFGEKILKNNLSNCKSFRGNAERLTSMFGEGEIDFLYLYFPDPWPKKAQLKNRTFNREWLKRIHPLLSSKGFFHIKTDHRGYFDHMIEEIQAVPSFFQSFDLTYDLHADHPNPRSLAIPEVTLFERLFIKDGLPIHSIRLKKT